MTSPGRNGAVRRLQSDIVAARAAVLFVDDDDGNLAVCEAHCSDDFVVYTATDAAAAMELLARVDNIGVILADQRMPGTSGIELLELVREKHPSVVRLLLTAYADHSAAVDAINRGQVRRYLKKPWQPHELKAEIQDALEIYSMSRRLEELGTRLRETERVYSLGIIAASIGHELRNPISWLHTSLELVRSHSAAIEELIVDSPMREDVAVHVEKLRLSLESAQSGVNRLFDLVRGISMPVTSRQSTSEVVDVEEVLRITVNLLSGEIRQAGRLISEVRGTARVRGSVTRVSQIILNLLVNATQALSAERSRDNTIRVSLSAEGPWVRFEVSDSGPGIPEADWERVFEPLFTTKLDGGTGLGLAISRQIAHELGGTLNVSRDEELGGARFCLRLPRSAEDSARTAMTG